MNRIWLCPPMAFSRVGSGTVPVAAYHWGPSDNSPRGSGKTTIVACETLDIDEHGVVSSHVPEEIDFKAVVEGKEVFRPVCPWYELHGDWTIDGANDSGPIAPGVLAACGIALQDISWEIKVANRKAYNMTLRKGDIVSATLSISGNDFSVHPLLGVCEADDPDEPPLVPHGSSLPFGHVQLANPLGDIPGVRLRITPPIGAVYGPKGVQEKITRIRRQFPDAAVNNADLWEELRIPSSRLILNDAAAWPNWILSNGDARTVPVLQFANIPGPRNTYHSLGLIDDFSDGIIGCTVRISRIGAQLQAHARVVTTPPDFAPDRRHIVSLADDLKDRVARDVEESFGSLPFEEMSGEVQDIFQRAWETMGLINLDAMNTKADFRDDATQPGSVGAPFVPPVSSHPLPLTQHGRRAHHRLAALDVLDNLLRERDARVETGTEAGYPTLRSLDDLINAPPNLDGTTAAGNSYRKMPALMRGSDGSPFHITRRQYDLLQLWIRRQQESAWRS